MKEAFKHAVRLKLEGSGHLEPIFSHVFDIPERVQDYDEHFFVVYNHRKEQFEIHSLDYPKGNTHSCTVGKQLDSRALEHIYNNDIRVHGREIFKRIEESEERARAAAEREQKNWFHSIAQEMQPYFAKHAWH